MVSESLDPRQLMQQVEGWADEFGGDYEVTLIGKRVIFVTDPEDIRRILLLRPSKFKRGWRPVSVFVVEIPCNQLSF